MIYEWLINNLWYHAWTWVAVRFFCAWKSQYHLCDYMDNVLGAKLHYLTRWPVTPYKCLHRSIEAPCIWIIRWYTSVWNSSEIVWAFIQQVPTKIIPRYYITKNALEDTCTNWAFSLSVYLYNFGQLYIILIGVSFTLWLFQIFQVNYFLHDYVILLTFFANCDAQCVIVANLSAIFHIIFVIFAIHKHHLY